jgi:predicted RNA-binding Zn-ribbon protein involved in translation (DUF1610 family)
MTKEALHSIDIICNHCGNCFTELVEFPCPQCGEKVDPARQPRGTSRAELWRKNNDLVERLARCAMDLQYYKKLAEWRKAHPILTALGMGPMGDKS